MKKKSKRLIQIKQQNERLKKHVAAIHSSGDLSLLERKMANVFLLNAYDDLLIKRSHSINVQMLSQMLGWKESNNTDRLKQALESLASTPLSFNEMKDGKESWRVMSMISYGHIENGICTYRYDEYLAERLYDPEIYATINLGIQRKLDGSYALALYENCLRYRSVGSTGWWDLELFRRLVGADNDYYNDFRRLNSKIIKFSVGEINKVTDIQIEPEFKRAGRKVVALRFLVTENPQQTLLSAEDLDDYAEIRKSSTFKNLRDHGIGERLAILWVLQDEERAKQVIDYVESKAKKKQVRGTTAGYIRKLIEDNAEVGQSNFEKELEQKNQFEHQEQTRILLEKKEHALKEEFLRFKTNKIIQSLSIDDKRKLINTYVNSSEAGPITSLNIEKGTFKNTVERLQYRVWLNKYLAYKFDADAFNEWLQVREN
ncbi:MAG: replication initiation protein [Candidatus Paceibacterota bacterium]|jgi:plasmid replication initiation protein